jgi:hypothetical protein
MRIDELCAELFDIAATALAEPLRTDTQKPMHRAACHAAAIAETLSDRILEVDAATLAARAPAQDLEQRGGRAQHDEAP